MQVTSARDNAHIDIACVKNTCVSPCFGLLHSPSTDKSTMGRMPSQRLNRKPTRLQNPPSRRMKTSRGKGSRSNNSNDQSRLLVPAPDSKDNENSEPPLSSYSSRLDVRYRGINHSNSENLPENVHIILETGTQADALEVSLENLDLESLHSLEVPRPRKHFPKENLEPLVYKSPLLARHATLHQARDSTVGQQSSPHLFSASDASSPRATTPKMSQPRSDFTTAGMNTVQNTTTIPGSILINAVEDMQSEAALEPI
jgi:hypothetical protein